jgi:hypothetical protein
MRLIPVTFILGLMIAGSVTPGFAQNLGWSHGTQSLRAGPDDCLMRAETALAAEGYRIDDRSESWRGGSKTGVSAHVTCNPAPGNSTWANIVVVSSATGRLADNEKARLQQRMEQRVEPGPIAGAGAGGFNSNRPVAATSTSLAGRWTWVATCRDSTPSGRFEIANQRQGGPFTGSFSNTNSADTGTIDGQQQGLLVEFRRAIPGVGEQRWSGGVERAGGALRMEGRIDGPGGPCTFSATSSNAAPRAAGASTNVTGTWNWTAECNGSRPSGRFNISSQRNGAIAGVFSNSTPTDTGTIDGRQQGLLIEFRRQIPGAGEQQWTGGLAANGGVLTMEGRIDGAGGPCNFSASLGR